MKTCTFLVLPMFFARLLQLRSTLLALAAMVAVLCATLQVHAQSAPGMAAAVAGEIVFVSGNVMVNGAVAPKGTLVREGAQLQTGPNSTLYLKTVDNGFLILRQNSQATVVAYQINSWNPQKSRAKIELNYGVARHISGNGVKQARQNFRFNTPVAAIGLRGTDFTVFADQQVMRVTVVSGGVVVGAFGAGCVPGGSGPCEGASTRELFAGNSGVLLQVKRGQSVPELLRSLELQPDVQTPARPDEPAAAGPAARRSGAADENTAPLSLDAPKAADLVVSAAPPPPPPPESRKAVWGRWEPVAGLPADEAKLAVLRDTSYLPGAVIGSYFITFNPAAEFNLPQEGRFAFRLTDGEAFIQKGNNPAQAAAITNPLLEIDFARRAFSTSMQLTAGGSAPIDIQARGDMTARGELFSDPITSNASVRGVVTGGAGEQASYIFNRQVDGQTRAIGGINWAR